MSAYNNMNNDAIADFLDANPAPATRSHANKAEMLKDVKRDTAPQHKHTKQPAICKTSTMCVAP